jgi:hypothetical protein
MNFAWNARLPRSIQGSFTCRKSATWDRRLYFPSEGRCAEDFFALKNPTASAGFEPANLGTKGQHATPRPPKPLYSGLLHGTVPDWTGGTEKDNKSLSKNSLFYRRYTKQRLRTADHLFWPLLKNVFCVKEVVAGNAMICYRMFHFIVSPRMGLIAGFFSHKKSPSTRMQFNLSYLVEVSMFCKIPGRCWLPKRQKLPW